MAPVFETLLKSREAKAQAKKDGLKQAFKQPQAWLEPPPAESELAIQPNDYVGRYIKYEKKGIGEVLEFHDGKKQKHSVEFQGTKGKPPKVSKVMLDTEAAAAGMFLVLDQDFVDTFVLQFVEDATAEWSRNEALAIIKAKAAKEKAAEIAARNAEIKRQAEMAKDIMLAPGASQSRWSNRSVLTAVALRQDSLQLRQSIQWFH